MQTTYYLGICGVDHRKELRISDDDWNGNVYPRDFYNAYVKEKLSFIQVEYDSDISIEAMISKLGLD